MSSPLRFSRIVTLYNQWHFLDWLEDDALFPPDTEYIFVDDFSASPMPAEVRAAIERRGIRVHRLSRNRGYANARNIAAEFARGEFVDFVDGDDRPLPLAYDPAWEKADVVFFRFELHGEGRDVQASWVRHPLLKVPDAPEGYIDPRPAAVLWRRTAFWALGGWEPRYEGVEDIEFVYRALSSPRAFAPRSKQSYNQQGLSDYSEIWRAGVRTAFYMRLPQDVPSRQDLLDGEARRLSLQTTWTLIRRRQDRFLFRAAIALLLNLVRARIGLLRR